MDIINTIFILEYFAKEENEAHLRGFVVLEVNKMLGVDCI